MRGRPTLRPGPAALALAIAGLAGCAAPPPPPPAAPLVLAPAPVLAMPLPPPPRPPDRPDPVTGLPPGWYVPAPPALDETGAEPGPYAALPPGWYVPSAPPVPEPAPAPATLPPEAEPAAPPPPPDPERRARALLRDFPWIAGFWAELGGEERARAERAFARRGTREGLATEWDRMGLQDRVVLLFGPGRAAQAG